jgi:glutaredoxin 2
LKIKEVEEYFREKENDTRINLESQLNRSKVEISNKDEQIRKLEMLLSSEKENTKVSSIGNDGLLKMKSHFE